MAVAVAPTLRSTLVGLRAEERRRLLFQQMLQHHLRQPTQRILILPDSLLPKSEQMPTIISATHAHLLSLQDFYRNLEMLTARHFLFSRSYTTIRTPFHFVDDGVGV